MRRALFVFALLIAASCEDETLPDPFVGCPNDMPTTGNECPRAGLVCHYFTSCSAYDEASCEASGRWTVTIGCTSSQGGAGSGGGGGATASTTASSTSSSSSATTGGTGGSTGGSGGF